ncbi:MAG: PEP/pyruvate-binding domain-containing protein [Chloroflexota bacterium]
MLVSKFSDSNATLDSVGGKGLSLAYMAQAGLPVPAGFVLTVAFFDPWLARVQQSAEWQQAVAAARSKAETLKAHCEAAKILALRFELNHEQEETLMAALAALKGKLFAVRSSSPEEDLAGASFAGGYETILGVTAERLEAAIRRAFVSCLDERILVYKQQHGFPLDHPRIAVIVQEQLASEVAGVAFSHNPLNNCYDEAVINANFGLGESVVSGMVSPDMFVVEKTKRVILQKKAGKKEQAIWLEADGGTRQEKNTHQALCLSDDQVLTLAALAGQVEQYYQKPMDIEWAFAGGKCYLLQARPITTHFALSESLVTPPGAPKQLYVDLTLSKWGMQEMMSVLGMEHLSIASDAMMRDTIGNVSDETLQALRTTVDGRTYMKLSNSFKLYGTKKAIESFRTQDTARAAILDQLDLSAYIPNRVPPELKGVLPRAGLKIVRLVWKSLQAYRQPDRYCRQHLRDIEATLAELRRILAEDQHLPLREFTTNTLVCMMSYISQRFMPCFTAAIVARRNLDGIFKKQPQAVRERLRYLERALPHNITIEMGLAMYRLSRFTEVAVYVTWDDLAKKLHSDSVSAEFRSAWQAFLDRYGFRSPMEMDVAAPRFYEQPERLFDQVRVLAQNHDAGSSPEAIHQKAIAEREQAYHELLAVARKIGKAKSFEKNYRVWVSFGGFRETGKYLYVYATDIFRRRALEIGQQLARQKRLDCPGQVFDLKLADLERAEADAALDLRALAENNTAYQRRYRHVRDFPCLIDSRGKVFSAPQRRLRPDELGGEAIAPGSVRGKIKVLRTPTEKPVLPGEILVARATDPGWTPLFVNAAGVILEVGGVLQHGALVAREYGKPCIAGIENATALLHDGQTVELDGSNGIVRLLN